MSSMFSRVLVLAAAAALAGSRPELVEGRAEPRETGKAPVSIRVVVSDSKGRPLGALAAVDFEVLAGERPQTLERVVPPAPGRRVIGILLDEYHLSPAAADTARPALLDFAGRHLRADDAVFVMKPLEQASTLAPVADADALRARLSSLSGRLGDYTPKTPFEAEYVIVTPPAAARQRAQHERASMHELATAHVRVADAAERPKAMLVVTAGFGLEERRERLATLRTIARAARSASVGVYVVDPSPAAGEQTLLGDPWTQLAAQTGG